MLLLLPLFTAMSPRRQGIHCKVSLALLPPLTTNTGTGICIGTAKKSKKESRPVEQQTSTKGVHTAKPKQPKQEEKPKEKSGKKKKERVSLKDTVIPSSLNAKAVDVPKPKVASKRQGSRERWR
jgi:hypothetical protein